MKQITIPIDGMHCASCAAVIENDLKNVRGVKNANVNYATTKAVVEYDDTALEATALHEAIKKSGYVPVIPRTAQAADQDHSRMHHGYISRNGLILVVLLAIPLLGSMFWKPDLGTALGHDGFDFIQLVIAWLLVAYFGRAFHVGTMKQIIRLRANMDTLVTIGTFAALLWSTYAFIYGGDVYFEVSGMIITFLLIGKFIEERQRSKASAAIQSLLELHAKLAHRLKEDGSTEDVDPSTLREGDRCLVKPGERIPMDGVIEKGHTTIDESMLTGESIPVERGEGSEVYGATVNGTGSITIRITAAQGMTVLDSIIRTVEHALSTKSPVERVVDQVSAIFVPAVIGLAIITLIAWLIYSGGDAGESIRHAVAVLIVACPCAMGLATPAAILVGTGAAAKRGVLIKDGSALEQAKRINTIVFDKTGTITEGKPVITDVIPSNGQEDRLLAVAAGLEQASEHPLAAAVLQYVEEKKITAEDQITSIEAVVGKGIRGRIANHHVILGTQSLMEEEGIPLDERVLSEVQTLRSDGKTLMFVAEDGVLLGVLAAQDEPKSDASSSIQTLKALGLEVAMISGDHEASAKAIAKRVGIEQVFANVSPTEKSEIVAKLQKEGKRVAFVGDGINDAPALAKADLGIAVGTGTDIAIATGQVVLMSGKPSKTVDAIRISRKTFNAIRQNLFWAFIYNTLGIPLAAFGILSPMIASAAMALSSVSVLMNSLRIRRSLHRA
ncbi:heavy metal translocating P-type ATPase [Candidatus Uhrbacteria bacterium]|nr:heavy metal translocating P-type ATPase [Candidatus Uhrbacteria bacterium]MBD3284375.1 heavy metal translocating P-type ATPase [Candidatus Uhrbacteria bacterium]